MLLEAHDEWQVSDRRYLSEAAMAAPHPASASRARTPLRHPAEGDRQPQPQDGIVAVIAEQHANELNHPTEHDPDRTLYKPPFAVRNSVSRTGKVQFGVVMAAEASVPPNLPKSWYVYGQVVLDRVCGGPFAADHIDVAYYTVVPTADHVREMLGLPRKVSCIMNYAPHRIAFNIDTMIITDSNALSDVGASVSDPSSPLTVEALTPHLTVEDILRLRSALSAYPELVVAAELRNKVESDYLYLLSQQNRFADVATAILAHTPVASWRR